MAAARALGLVVLCVLCVSGDDRAPSPPSQDASCTALPTARQGASAVAWRNASDVLLLVGGSTSPGGCKPPYTEWPTIFIGEPDSSDAGDAADDAGAGAGARSLAWRNFATMPAGRTHASAVLMDAGGPMLLYILGGYGPGPCLHSPSRTGGKCAHSTVWVLDLSQPGRGATAKAPMPYNRSNFGTAVVGTNIYTAGGYVPVC